MTTSVSRRAFALSLFLLSLTGSTFAQIIPADSEEGMLRLSRAEYKADFVPLANHFESQGNDFFCGPTSSVIVLNALHTGGSSPYTQESFFDAATNHVKTRAQVTGQAPGVSGKPDYGLQLAQLQKILEGHGLKVTAHVVGEKVSTEAVRADFVRNLGNRNDYVLINYKRSVLGQEGGGHISPVGAYDSKSDSVLILDVNPGFHEWVWADLLDLVRAMGTFDTLQNRGYLLVSR